MTKPFALTVIFLSFTFGLFAQSAESQDDFDRAFLDIYMHKAGVDLVLALKSADSLYRVSASDIHKIRSLMLISDVYHRSANRDSSIHYAERAGEIAERTGNYNWQARIYGVLSTQHRETGLLNRGRQYLKKGLQAAGRITDINTANQFKGHVHQEMGFYSLAEEAFSDAIPHFKEAEAYFMQLPDSPNKNFFLAQNEERLGIAYLQQGAVDSAEAHFFSAKAYDEAIPQDDTPIKGFIANGMGLVNLRKGRHDEAFVHLNRALEIAETTQFPNLRIEVFRSLAQYYEAVGDMEQYRRYNEQYLDAVKTDVNEHRDYADNMVTRAQRRLDSLMASFKNTVLGALVLLLIATIGAGAYVKKQQQDRRRFKEVIAKLRQERQQPPVASTAEQGMEDKALMPEATRLDLLKKLERFESGVGFTDKRISIAVLAGKFNTNTKYLSHVINKHRHKDFNTYINELRVNYLIAKMESDPKYLNYKISYLADEGGFSTHSQFTTVFKQVVGLSPSVFITYLKKARKKEETLLAS